jgi:predicted metal-dependent hydrolase
MQTAATQLPLFPERDEPDSESGFSVRRSDRARRLSIKVYPRGRVEVVVPRRTSARTVQAFVESHRSWISKTRAAFAAEHPAEPFALPSRIHLPAIDRAFCVRYERATDAGTVRYRTIGGTIVLSGATDDEESCVAALKRWLAGLAKQEFLPRLKALSAETGNAYRRMQVRGQRTCWGSHSGKGTISLNFCLLFLQPRQLRYVLVHELCHARHMNHSQRFWRLVGRHEPDYRRLDKALNEAWKHIPTWVGLY